MTEHYWQPPKAERPDVVGAGANTVILTNAERDAVLVLLEENGYAPANRTGRDADHPLFRAYEQLAQNRRGR